MLIFISFSLITLSMVSFHSSFSLLCTLSSRLMSFINLSLWVDSSHFSDLSSSFIVPSFSIFSSIFLCSFKTVSFCVSISSIFLCNSPISTKSLSFLFSRMLIFISFSLITSTMVPFHSSFSLLCMLSSRLMSFINLSLSSFISFGSSSKLRNRPHSWFPK